MFFISAPVAFAIPEQTVQQERIPQPPPPPKFGGGVETSVSEPDVQLKDEITFFSKNGKLFIDFIIDQGCCIMILEKRDDIDIK